MGAHRPAAGCNNCEQLELNPQTTWVVICEARVRAHDPPMVATNIPHPPTHPHLMRVGYLFSLGGLREGDVDLRYITDLMDQWLNRQLHYVLA